MAVQQCEMAHTTEQALTTSSEAEKDLSLSYGTDTHTHRRTRDPRELLVTLLSLKYTSEAVNEKVVSLTIRACVCVRIWGKKKQQHKQSLEWMESVQAAEKKEEEEKKPTRQPFSALTWIWLGGE